jgi:hypothetical protein
MGVYTGTVPTFLAGELPDADKLTEVSNFMTAMTAAWTTYTPTWTASAGVPAIGNGSLTGRYRRIGKTVDFEVALLAGTTTTYGTAGAFWSFGLPPVGNTAATYAFPMRMFDTGVLEYVGIASVAAGGSTVDLYKSPTGRFLNNSFATAFGNTDTLWFNGTYELA